MDAGTTSAAPPAAPRKATRSPAGRRNARIDREERGGGDEGIAREEPEGEPEEAGRDLFRVGRDLSVPKPAASACRVRRPRRGRGRGSGGPPSPRRRGGVATRTRGRWRTPLPPPPRSGCRIAGTAGFRPSLSRHISFDARRRAGPMLVHRPRREDGHGRHRDGTTGPCTGFRSRARFLQVREVESWPCRPVSPGSVRGRRSSRGGRDGRGLPGARHPPGAGSRAEGPASRAGRRREAARPLRAGGAGGRLPQPSPHRHALLARRGGSDPLPHDGAGGGRDGRGDRRAKALDLPGLLRDRQRGRRRRRLRPCARHPPPGPQAGQPDGDAGGPGEGAGLRPREALEGRRGGGASLGSAATQTFPSR